MLTLALLLLACSDSTFTVGVDGNAAWPDIEVTPASLDLGAVPLDGSAEGEITIRNVGNAALLVQSVDMDSATGAFSLPEVVAGLRLAAGEQAPVAVRFQPFNTQDTATAMVRSDDPDEPALPVALQGRGAFPQLEITPSPVDLGDVELCEAGQTPVTLRNAGEAELEIDHALLTGEGLSLGGVDDLPLSLAPGESRSAWIDFVPERAAAVAGELWVDSTDPVGARQATVSATGVVDGAVRGQDVFRQPDGPWDRTDIMFFVDRSCSMKDDEANLRANIGELADVLAEADSDWQIMVTIDDNGCHEGELLTPDTPSLTTAFTEALATAPGSFTEAGLTIVANGLERAVGGGCNDGFLRPDSKTLVVTVSDEPEQSPDPWESYVARIHGVAPTAGVVAVVGDVPDGCPTAEPGTGYTDAADATGGAFLSICSADWGEYFQTVGALATSGPVGTFPLSQQPDPDTVTVSIDGESNAEWDYDAVANAVVFRSWPAPLSQVVVDYTLSRSCE